MPGFAPAASRDISRLTPAHCPSSSGPTRRWPRACASSLAPKLAAGVELTPLLLAEEAEAGDDLSLEIVLETARYLGVGVVTLMHTIDPSGVVLGGAMNFGGNQTELGRRFLARVKEEVQRRAFPVLAERTKIDYATLGGDAGFIGAAGIARLEDRKLSPC